RTFAIANRSAADTPATSAGSSRTAASWMRTASGAPLSSATLVTPRAGVVVSMGRPASSTYTSRPGNQYPTASDGSPSVRARLSVSVLAFPCPRSTTTPATAERALMPTRRSTHGNTPATQTAVSYTASTAVSDTPTAKRSRRAAKASAPPNTSAATSATRQARRSSPRERARPAFLVHRPGSEPDPDEQKPRRAVQPKELRPSERLGDDAECDTHRPQSETQRGHRPTQRTPRAPSRIARPWRRSQAQDS